MPDYPGEKLLFGRYSREDCGLPPEGWRGPEAGVRPLLLALLLAALVDAGWLGGNAMARWREMQLALLPAQVAADPENASALLAKGKIYATALPAFQSMRRNLALAALVAAERAPRSMGYYANAANLLRGAKASAADAPEAVFGIEITAAGVYAELGDYQAAFDAVARADEGLNRVADENVRRSFRLLLVNAQAYFLATAGKDKGGDPLRALRLARLMITSRDELPGGGYASGSAAFLDTLAAARSAAGDAAGAAAAQALALGLADSQSLDVYLRHYDEFR